MKEQSETPWYRLCHFLNHANTGSKKQVMQTMEFVRQYNFSKEN